MDIVVLSHIPEANGINIKRFEEVIECLIRVVYPNVEVVAFSVGTQNPDGINAIQIKTIIFKGTKDQLEHSLLQIFKQPFEISCKGENALPTDNEALVKATADLLGNNR